MIGYTLDNKVCLKFYYISIDVLYLDVTVSCRAGASCGRRGTVAGRGMRAASTRGAAGARRAGAAARTAAALAPAPALRCRAVSENAPALGPGPGPSPGRAPDLGPDRGLDPAPGRGLCHAPVYLDLCRSNRLVSGCYLYSCDLCLYVWYGRCNLVSLWKNVSES